MAEWLCTLCLFHLQHWQLVKNVCVCVMLVLQVIWCTVPCTKCTTYECLCLSQRHPTATFNLLFREKRKKKKKISRLCTGIVLTHMPGCGATGREPAAFFKTTPLVMGCLGDGCSWDWSGSNSSALRSQIKRKEVMIFFLLLSQV